MPAPATNIPAVWIRIIPHAETAELYRGRSLVEFAVRSDGYDRDSRTNYLRARARVRLGLSAEAARAIPVRVMP